MVYAGFHIEVVAVGLRRCPVIAGDVLFAFPARVAVVMFSHIYLMREA